MLNNPITISQTSQLEHFQLKEPQVAKYLDLSDPDKTYMALKNLSYGQYKYLNLLFSKKQYKKIAMLFLENGIKPNQDYVDYLNEMSRENYADHLEEIKRD